MELFLVPMISLSKDYGVLEKSSEESMEKIDLGEALCLIVLSSEESVVDRLALNY